MLTPKKKEKIKKKKKKLCKIIHRVIEQKNNFYNNFAQ